MTTHKAIREALASVETICKWTAEGHDVWAGLEPFDMLVGNAEDANDAAFIAACNPAAIRALLADLDAKTEALKSVQAAIYMDDAGQLRLTRSFDEAVIDAALKGTP